MDPASQTVLAVKRRLRDLWQPFFGRFGRLTPIQAEAIPLLLSGRNVVMTSPTASGKTEAALAPALHHILRQGLSPEGPQLLYVIPTRALVADMSKRFARLFAELRLSVAFRTSDTPYLPAPFPTLLFTTPESFDSLLCRRKKVWSNVRIVVLDELHQVDSTYRGDQLRILLRRLDTDWPQEQPRLKAILSATVPDPAGMAERYIGPAAVAGAGLARTIDLHVVPTMEQAVALAREHRRHKILVFCNSRKECEHEAAQIISRRLWPAANVLVHHASLSAPVRKEVERTLLESTHALCFATTTLELGVDIGDVSAVFLYRPPLLPSSFQQRIGRACRRERSIFAVGIAQAPDDEEVFQAFADMARAAAVEPGHYEPDWSVVVQQLFSLLFAHPAGLPRDRLYDYLSPLCEPDLFHAILDHLVHQQHLVGRGPLVQAGESVMTAGEKGDIHANIPDERHRTLVDSTTGKVIGEAMVGPEEHSLILAGRIWTVARTQGSRVFVRPSSEKPKSLLFSRRSGHGKYYSYLPVPVQERMAGRGSAHE